MEILNRRQNEKHVTDFTVLVCLTWGCLIVRSQKNLKSAFTYCDLFSAPNPQTQTNTHTQACMHTFLKICIFFPPLRTVVHVEIPPRTSMYLCLSFVIVLF